MIKDFFTWISELLLISLEIKLKLTRQKYSLLYHNVFTFPIYFLLLRKNLHYFVFKYRQTMEKFQEVDLQMSKITSKIVEARKEKGFSLENIADELGISVSAYNKIEKQETKLTVERLLQIQIALDTTLNDFFDFKTENIYNQNLQAHSTGFQGIQHLHQENKELFEKYIGSLNDQINFLRKQLEEK